MTRETFMYDGLRQIWKEAFNEDDAYIDFFLKEGLPLGHLHTYGPNDAPFSALTLFPLTFHQAGVNYSGFYLYALGTLHSKRGLGYGKLLLKTVEKYALDTGCHFILLQPTNFSLFEYYHRLGYTEPIYRAFIECSRDTLSSNLLNSPLFTHFSNLSAPLENPFLTQKPFYNRFIWPPSLIKYIRKECIFRGGIVTNGAFCYPHIDTNGPFIEIKEFHITAEKVNTLFESILHAFPNFSRFRFYGKPQIDIHSSIQQAPFALIHFVNPDLKQHYVPLNSYFALGLD